VAVTIGELQVELEPQVQPAGPSSGATPAKTPPDVRSELAIARERELRLRAD
jgi:hypothetical protein